VPPDTEIVKIASEQLGKPVFTGDPLDIIEPGIPAVRTILQDNGLPVTDENIFIVGALATKGGNKGLDFLKGQFSVNVRKIEKKAATTAAPAAKPAAPAAGASATGDYTVMVNGVRYDVRVAEGSGQVLSAQPASAAVAPAPVRPVAGTEIPAPVPGNVLSIPVSVGQSVAEGDLIAILEAMKMETPVKSPMAGKILAIEITKGSVVQAGQVMMVIG